MRFAFKTYAAEERAFPELACHPVSRAFALRFARHLERISPGPCGAPGRLFPVVSKVVRVWSITPNGARVSYAECSKHFVERGNFMHEERRAVIALDEFASWLTLVHELAHAWEWAENANGRHDRAFHRRVRLFARLAQSGDWHIRDVIANANAGVDL